MRTGDLVALVPDCSRGSCGTSRVRPEAVENLSEKAGSASGCIRQPGGHAAIAGEAGRQPSPGSVPRHSNRERSRSRTSNSAQFDYRQDAVSGGMQVAQDRIMCPEGRLASQDGRNSRSVQPSRAFSMACHPGRPFLSPTGRSRIKGIPSTEQGFFQGQVGHDGSDHAATEGGVIPALRTGDVPREHGLHPGNRARSLVQASRITWRGSPVKWGPTRWWHRQ